MRLGFSIGTGLLVLGLGWIWSSNVSFRFHRDEARFGAVCMALGAGAVAYFVRTSK